MKIQSINPCTGEINAEFNLLSREELDQKISQADKAFSSWKKTSTADKKKLFLKLAEILENNKEELAKLDVIEMGMTYKNALGDVSKSASGVRWFAENFENILADREFDTAGVRGKIIHEPLGVLYSVAPWNYPFNQAMRNAIPNILAGNTVLNKHASNVPLVAGKLEELFLEAGFPVGVFQNLYISSRETEYVISHEVVKGTNITGGEVAGRNIGSLAGKYLKPSLLELGGSDPFIVLENDNLDSIVKDTVKARFSNNGQKCNSAKRFIILDKYYDEFVEKFIKLASELVIGDPMNEKTDISPLAKSTQLEELEQQVQDSVAAGANLLLGGKRCDMKGNFFPPTVLSEVTPDMKVFREEVFGPVAPIIRASSIQEAIELANDCKWGLGCSIYGNNDSQLQEVGKQIEAGNVFINKVMASYFFLPYGGIKETGYGKELAENGLKAFVNEKVLVY